MDYKIVAVLDDGTTQEQHCATATDVENHAVQFLRQGIATQSKIVNLTIVSLWLTEN